MSACPIAIKSTGLVTSVGLSAAASCAAIRAGISGASESRFIDPHGEWIMAHQVLLSTPWGGVGKLLKMAAMAITDCLGDCPQRTTELPLFLCESELGRAGRTAGLGGEFIHRIEEELGVLFSTRSTVYPHGRVGVAVALNDARELICTGQYPAVLVAAVDSLLTDLTIDALIADGRLHIPSELDGFIPGEAAGALLVEKPEHVDDLLCTGFGFGVEKSHIGSSEPLRADGLTTAIKASLNEAGCAMYDVGYRIADLSGEQYYFKEADLALSRTLRNQKEQVDLWHLADCIGEVGAAAGVVALSVAFAAHRKNYAPGPTTLAHFSNDEGARAAIIVRPGGIA